VERINALALSQDMCAHIRSVDHLGWCDSVAAGVTWGINWPTGSEPTVLQHDPLVTVRTTTFGRSSRAPSRPVAGSPCDDRRRGWSGPRRRPL